MRAAIISGPSLVGANLIVPLVSIAVAGPSGCGGMNSQAEASGGRLGSGPIWRRMGRDSSPLTPRQQLDAAMASERKRKAGAPRANWTKDQRGRNHPSAGEAEWFDAQYARAARGEIEILDIEPSWPIQLLPEHVHGGPQHLCNVKADMRVREAGRVRVLDYKGHAGDTEVSRLKRRAVLIQWGVEIELVGRYIEAKARAKAKKAAERALLKRAKPKD